MADNEGAAGIRAAIHAAGGAIPFEEFMRLALYGRGGFYVGGGSAGRRGDFLTSPEVGPLFGAVLARWLDAEWDRLDRPQPFTVVDVGAGPGTLARAIVAAAPVCAMAMHYVAVEISPSQRMRHPAGVTSSEGLPEGRFDGVIIANELLDNLPFRLAVHDASWREAFVAAAPDGSFDEVLSAPFAPPPHELPDRAAHGARAPLHAAAADWVGQARSRLRTGTLLVIDYAVATTAVLAERPWREWLRTYRGHQRGGHYLAAPGTQDITTEIALDQFPEPDIVRTQAQFLQRWGIDELVAEGKRVWEQQAALPGLEAMRMRSRIAEAEALLDPGGLGGFTVVEWRA